MVSVDEYRSQCTRALSNFQFIEEALRMYISYSYRLIMQKLDKQIPFSFTYNDVKNDSLGKLLKKFKKINANSQLIKNLKELKKERDFIAHQAFLLTSGEQKDILRLAFFIKEAKQVVRDSDACLNKLIQEVKIVSAKTKT